MPLSKVLAKLGTVYDNAGPTQAGAGLTNGTYVPGTAFADGTYDVLTLVFAYAFGGASALTVKLQGSMDGTKWVDVQTMDSSGTTAIEHSYASGGGAGADSLQTANVAAFAGGVRLSVKATGVTNSSDTVSAIAAGHRVAL